MHATLVHNPGAGACRPSPKKLMALLKDAGFSATYRHAKDEDLPEALQKARGIVIAAGGDGTVGRVATQLPQNVPMAILPLGTANNIARVFGVAGTVEELIAGIRSAEERKLDVCAANGPWGERRFVEAVGIGALADSTRQKIRDEKNVAKRLERGRDAFRKALSRAEPVRVDLLVDGRRIQGEMLLAEIMNIGLVGPNLRLAPVAGPGDGRLDVVLIPVEQREEMMAWLENPEVEDAPVAVETGSTVRVAKSSSPLRIGDKISEKSKGDVTIEVREQRTILVQPGTAHDDAGRGKKRKSKR